MAFDPFADPFSMYNPGIGETVPKLKPEVAEDWLDKIGDDLIGGLGYIGQILDKPGRAVRGILDTVTGGGPASLRETLAILPFSDSIGLTREDDRVSGEKLLRNVGLISAPDNNEFDENDAAGIAAEILFDPLSYLGIGTLTKGGKALQKAGGKVNVGFKARAAGADFAQSDINKLLGKFDQSTGIADLMTAGDVTARDFVTKADNVIPEGVQGLKPRFRIGEESLVPDQTLQYLSDNFLNDIPRNAVDAIEAIRSGNKVLPGRYTSLDGFIGGLPSYKVLEAGPDSATQKLVRATKEATDDATRLGSTITLGKAPLGIDRLLGLEPFRIESGVLDRGIDALSAGIQGSRLGAGFSRLFDSRVGNARTPEVQAVQRDVGASAREGYRAEALTQSMDLRQKALDGFAPLIDSGNEAEAMRMLRQVAEDIDPITAGSGVKYGAARSLAEEEAQLASRPATNPLYPNRLDEMKATGEIAGMRNSFLGREALGQDMAGLMKTIRDAEAATGVKSTELMDQFAEYLPRRKNPLPRKDGESAFSYMDRVLKDAIRTTHEGQLQRSKLLTDIPGGTEQINDWVKAGESLRAMPTKDRVAYFVNELTGSPVTTNADVLDKAKGLADAVTEWKGYEKVGLFDSDIMSSIERRLLGGAAAKGGMDATLETVRRFAMTEAEAQAKGMPFTRVSDFVSQEGFSREAAELARRDLRLNSQLGLKGMVLPQDIAADLAKVQKAWTNPEEVQGIVKLWDSALQMFKGAVTYPFPAFHVRNVGSGIYNMWRDNAASSSAMRDAYKVLTSNADLPGMSRQQLVKEAVANRVAFLPHTKQFGDLGAEGGSLIQGLPGKLAGEGIGENLMAGAKANAPQSWKDVGFIVREGKAAGSFVEDWIRLSHYLAKRQQGFEPAAAASAVRKYQYDYSQFTQAERNVFKRLIPWWCVPTDHEILTKNGWRFSHELTVGQEVMSYHQKFGTMMWVPLEDVQEFDFDGELMEINHKRGHFLFTDDHRWPVETVQNKVGKYFYPSRKVVKRGYELVDGDSIPRCGRFTSDSSIMTARMAALLGWVVTDGTFRWKGKHCEMVIYQSDKKFWREIMELTKLPAREGIDTRMDEPVRVYPVAIEDVKEITKVFYSKDDLPRIVCQLGPAAAEAMYQAMVQAEGSYAGPNRDTVYFSQKAERNKPVLEAFQILCLMTCRSAAVKDAGCYVTTNKFMKFQKRTTGRKRYKGKIWCPVTKFGTWVMRHEGHTIITGNTFSRNNLPPILEDLATQPAKLAGSIRGATARPDDQFVPQYISEGPAIPIPGGGPGTERYIASLGLPFEDEMIRTLGNVLQGKTTRAVQQQIGTLAPPVKYPIEQAFGIQAHTGRRLDDLKPTPAAELLSAIAPLSPQAANQVIGLTPLARFGSVSNQVLDERKDWLDKLVNLGTGAWITDVDATKARNVEVRDMLENMLRQNKGVTNFDKFYVKPENLGKLNQQELQAYLLYRTLEDKAKEQAAKRKAQVPLPGGF